jgi:DNA-binding transcriptional MerR regulator
MPLKVLDTPIDMAIGTLAERTGVNVPTIRYYEEIGLLPPAHRRPSGHRVYSATQVQLLNFIRRFRDFGFSIDQVRELVALAQNECDDSQEACDIAQTHLDTVRLKLIELGVLERSLSKVLSDCAQALADRPAPRCDMLRELGGAPAQPSAFSRTRRG